MITLKINVHPRLQLKTGTTAVSTGTGLSVGTINGLLKANGAGGISRAVPLIDYMLPYNMFSVVQWQNGVSYAANTIVSVDLGAVVYYVICKSAHVSADFISDIGHWSLLSLYYKPI